jgi:bacterioferritin
MPTKNASQSSAPLTRKRLVDLLNEDLAREFQAIIAYVNYSQVLKGAAYMNIAAELAVHAGEELAHAIILSNQIDYFGGMPTTVPKPVKTSEKAEDMLRFDLDNENETIRQYRRRVKQCDELGEYATAEQLPRNISGRYSCRSRITRSPWQPRSASIPPKLASPTKQPNRNAPASSPSHRRKTNRQTVPRESRRPARVSILLCRLLPARPSRGRGVHLTGGPTPRRP